MSIENQVFWSGQLVNQNNMNDFYNDVGQKLSSYFNQTPCIMSGLSYTQTGTSNVINVDDGWFRWVNQLNSLSTTYPQFTFANIKATTVTVTCPSSATQKYIVAKITKTEQSANVVLFSGSILSTAYTLAEISQFANPEECAPIWTITNTNGIYTVGVDANCAFNYGQTVYLPVLNSILSTYGELDANNEWTGHNNFIHPLQINGYYVATYNAGFKFVERIGYNNSVAPDDANVLFRPQGGRSIIADGQVHSYPIGFTFSVAGDGEYPYMVILVNQDRSLNTTTRLSGSGIYQFTWSGRGWYMLAGSLQNELTITNSNNVGAGIIASGSNAIGSWEKYANGKIKQWGVYTTPPIGESTISFPVSFTATPRVVASSADTSLDFGSVSCVATANNFSVKTYNNQGIIFPNALSFNWIAEGY